MSIQIKPTAPRIVSLYNCIYGQSNNPAYILPSSCTPIDLSLLPILINISYTRGGG